MSDKSPIYKHPRGLSAFEKEEVDKQMEKWIKN